MVIEKISGSGSMPYQGSAAIAVTPSVEPAPQASPAEAAPERAPQQGPGWEAISARTADAPGASTAAPQPSPSIQQAMQDAPTSQPSQQAQQPEARQSGAAAAARRQGIQTVKKGDAASTLREEQRIQEERRQERVQAIKDEQAAQDKRLRSAISDLNKQMNNSEAIFGIHDKTNRVTIKIVDKTTKEVIKEYPPEQTLDMIAKIWEIAGILVDEKL